MPRLGGRPTFLVISGDGQRTSVTAVRGDHVNWDILYSLDENTFVSAAMMCVCDNVGGDATLDLLAFIHAPHPSRLVP